MNKREQLLSAAVQQQLSYEETQKLLIGSGENELYVRDRRDFIIIWGLYHGKEISVINEVCRNYYCPLLKEGA